MKSSVRILVATAILPVLSACVETQSNLAPVIDRSIRPTATVTTVTGAASTGATPVAAPVPIASTGAQAVPLPRDGARGATALPAAPASAAGAGGPVEPVIAPVAAAPSVETHALQPIAAPPLHVIAVDAPPSVAPEPAVPVPVPVPAPVPVAGEATGAAGAIAPPVAPDAAPPGDADARPDWIWPVQGSLAVRFDPAARDPVGRGIEIKVAEDAEVVAVADGVVRYVGHSKEYGNLIVVRHPGDWMSVYAFVRRALVAEGASVRRGQAIAVAGSTPGRKARLHFEARRGKGSVVDPMTLLPSRH